MAEKLSVRAMAKVNLALDVLRRRENGYHDVKMIMQTIDLYDVLTFEKKDQKDIELHCDSMDIPNNDDNLIYKAARMFFEKYPSEKGVLIHLEKNIPVAAGMAGGSTDAASTLIALNELFEAELSKAELAEIGVKIGADVPYCIYGGTCLSEGIGEILTPVENNLNCFVVIAKPNFGVSTKYVYENLHVETIKKHPDIDCVLAAIKKNQLHSMAEKMENILENVTIKKYPQIQEMKNILISYGALNALMSGSGPTVFALFENKDDANRAFQELKRKEYFEQGCVTTLINKTGTIEKE